MSCIKLINIIRNVKVNTVFKPIKLNNEFVSIFHNINYYLFIKIHKFYDKNKLLFRLSNTIYNYG